MKHADSVTGESETGCCTQYKLRLHFTKWKTKEVNGAFIVVLTQVYIEINGEQVDLHMKLGENGEAFFLEEAAVEVGLQTVQD